MVNKKDELEEEIFDDEEAGGEEFAEDQAPEEEEPLKEASEETDLPEEAEELADPASQEALRMTADVPVQLIAVLGKKTISVKDLVGLKTGQVLDLARPVNEVVDLIAGGKLVAKGELVDIDGKLGVKVIKMIR